MSALFNKSADHAGWPERVIKIDEEGFSVVEDGVRDNARCCWSAVLEVFAYKMDLFSYDEICIGFRIDAVGNYWWVGESYTGYEELLAELPKRYPGIRSDWFPEVAHPAFVQNRTTLWGESVSSIISRLDAQPPQSTRSARG